MKKGLVWLLVMIVLVYSGFSITRSISQSVQRINRGEVVANLNEIIEICERRFFDQERIDNFLPRHGDIIIFPS